MSRVESRSTNANEPKETPRSADAGSRFEHLTVYLFVPILFLLVIFMGGVRLAPSDGSILFMPPELIALVLSALTLMMVFRSGAFSFSAWFDPGYPFSKKAANAGILAALFLATSQVYNSLTPEKGLMHWAFVFCFFWAIVLWMLADMPAGRVIAGLALLFSMAFVAKYVVLAGLASPADKTWIERVWDDPAREAASFVFGKQKFAPATGYLQFFNLAVYFWALWLLPRKLS
jgi:hypothetical protein